MTGSGYILAALFLLGMPAGAYSDTDAYLDRESLQFPQGASSVDTTQPLAPFVVYRVLISSPFGFDALLESEDVVYLDNQPARLWSYETGLYGVTIRLRFFCYGKGRPLNIRLEQVAEQNYESITAEVFRHHWWQSWHGRGLHPRLLRPLVASVILAIALSATAYFSPSTLTTLRSYLFEQPAIPLREERHIEQQPRILRPRGTGQTERPLRRIVIHPHNERNDHENHRD